MTFRPKSMDKNVNKTGRILMKIRPFSINPSDKNLNLADPLITLNNEISLEQKK